MSEERKKILEMLAAGKISADEAERLIAALETAEHREREADGRSTRSTTLRYLRVVVDDSEHRVNVRIPIKLIRAGLSSSMRMSRSLSSRCSPRT